MSYVLPPGGTTADQLGIPGRKHYVELTISNKIGTRLKLGLREAYVYGASGSVLRIVDKRQAEEVSSGESVLFHVDTDGYLEHRLIEDSVRAPLRMLIWFGARGSSVADLPSFEELHNKGQVTLRWTPTTGTPIRAKAAVKKAAEWARNPLGTPVLTRTQLAETAYYLYYPFAPDKVVELDTERQRSRRELRVFGSACRVVNPIPRGKRVRNLRFCWGGARQDRAEV